ncbi:MAG: UDP-N-acetylglucosamine 4,6-dehydratase (inverting) [Anaerolineae bacterium]|nr:UDP-N-acetylglucosamine 4,6-dehydratase (inverting) [Anaerolineae bacterium]
MMDWKNSTILVTGGTGSFGKKFTKIILEKYQPKKLIIFSRDELKQHEMRVAGYNAPNLRYFIGDVRDADRLRRAFHGVDLVVHAAALKQVPACEYNPMEAILTNINGGKNVIDAAIDAGVKRVVALSTDKAVNPVNLYGATKLCAEKLFVQSNAYGGADGTRFACVRYGNVVGSRGSVIPVFLDQRKHGKITITDPRMTRFWITLEQGVQLVIRAAETMLGGEVFIPKIPSMNIMDLAKAIAPDCDVAYTGIRPGEKLHEQLISEDEARQTLEMPDVYIVEPAHPWWSGREHKDGKRLPDQFRYSSETNPDWLTMDQLRDMAALESEGV